MSSSARPSKISSRASSAPVACSDDPAPPPLPIQKSISGGGPGYMTINSFPSNIHNHNNNNNTSPQSAFKHALRDCPVPKALTNGIDVLHVFANGKTQQCVLSLSQDKFTLHIESIANSTGGSSTGYGSGIIGSSIIGSTTSSWFKRKPGKVHRKIDIGSIHRIQRGHTERFENLTRTRSTSIPVIRTSSMSNSNMNYNYVEVTAISSTMTTTTTTAMTTLSNNDNNASSSTDDEEEQKKNQLMESLDPSRSFSIIFRGDWTLDLILLGSPDVVTRDEILDALDEILQTYQKSKVKVSNDVLLLRYVWLDADKDNSNTITSNELFRLLQQMNYYMKKSQLNELYEKFGKLVGLDRKKRRQGLTFEQTCTLLHRIKRDNSWLAKPVNTYWDKLFGQFMKNGKPRMTVSDNTFLTKFLHKKQGEVHATIDDVRKIFEHLNEFELPHIADGHPKDPTRIDKNRFEAFLLAEDNDAFDPAREQYDERLMTRPISEYWVNSSHNTYLTGDQLTSHSSVDMYSNALYRGCKCLELDIWDEKIGADGVPIPVVWHGHTMTSKILFKDILRAIKLFLNFHPDTFPLILSFENHCSIPYQEVMAEQLVEILGDSLYIPKEESLNGILPSPLDLRGYVVIKGRRPNDLDLGVYDFDDDVSDDGAPSTIYGAEQPPDPQKKIRYGVCPELARLTLFHGTKLKSWDDSIMNPTHNMHSFSENKVRSLARKTDRMKWVIYNQSHMSRTYPGGSRVDSSNYMPLLAWSVGCQLVALNFQTNDVALRLNDGRFRENGGCGYVLKPTGLMEMQDAGAPPRSPFKLSIRVLSGSCLPKPKEEKKGECIDPYVRVSVYDVKNEKEVSTSFQTATVYNNGFFPIWNEEKFTFNIENHHVAMLQISVYDKDVASTDDLVASASIPISCLRLGLRSVKLFDASNTRSGAFDFASLLIDVKKERLEMGLAEF